MLKISWPQNVVCLFYIVCNEDFEIGACITKLIRDALSIERCGGVHVGR